MLRSTRLSVLLLLAIACGAPLSAVRAGDGAFDAHTLLLLSTDDVKAVRAGWGASQYGEFANDPSIHALWTHLKAGVAGFIRTQMATVPAGDSQTWKAQVKEITQLLDDYCVALDKGLTGRFALALGYRQVEGGAIQPEVLVHFQGGDGIASVNKRLLDIIERSSEGALGRASLDIQGVSFDGLVVPPSAGPPMVQPPDGLFIGHRGQDYYIGISKDGLAAYLSGAGDGRLGGDAFFQQATAATGAGQLRVLLNLQPIWQFVPMALSMSGAGPEVLGAISSLGLDSLHGAYTVADASAEGVSGRTFIGLGSRKGLLELVPATPSPAAVMPHTPRSAVMAGAVRVNLHRILDLVRQVVSSVGGEADREEMEKDLGEFESETGVKLDDLFASLAGTISFADLGPGEGAAFGMNPLAGASHMLLGAHVRNAGPWEKLLAAIAGHPELAGAVRVEEFLGRKIYRFGAEGGQPGMPSPAVVVDGEWVIGALELDDLKTGLRTAAEPDSQYGTAPEFRALLGKVGGGGMVVYCQDVGRALGAAADVAKFAVGMAAAMGLPQEVFDNEDLMYVLSPQNLPSAELFQKYFGKQVGSTHVVDGGLLSREWAPNPRAKKKKPVGEGL